MGGKNLFANYESFSSFFASTPRLEWIQEPLGCLGASPSGQLYYQSGLTYHVLWLINKIFHWLLLWNWTYFLLWHQIPLDIMHVYTILIFIPVFQILLHSSSVFHSYLLQVRSCSFLISSHICSFFLYPINPNRPLGGNKVISNWTLKVTTQVQTYKHAILFLYFPL
jgi:hypothetical protein